jgi:hypothetical protein
MGVVLYGWAREDLTDAEQRDLFAMVPDAYNLRVVAYPSKGRHHYTVIVNRRSDSEEVGRIDTGDILDGAGRLLAGLAEAAA